MRPPDIHQWDVGRMAKGHYGGPKSEEKFELCKFIKELLAEFSSKPNLKQTNITLSKIGTFHAYVEKQFKNNNREYNEDDVGAWTLAFMVYWYRNRKFVDESKISYELKDKFDNNRHKFYNTMMKEWEGQRKKGRRTDSILEYTITHPQLSKNPYFTIPMRLEYVRRLRTYWNEDENILHLCRSQLKICEAELENLDQNREVTCSPAPGTKAWIKVQLKMQNLLTDGREASSGYVKEIGIDQITPKSDHEEIYADVMRFWKLIGYSKDAENRLDSEGFISREEELSKYIKSIKKNNPDLGEYLDYTKKDNDLFVDGQKKAILENKKDPTPEDFLLIYFHEMLELINAKTWSKVDSKNKDHANHSLRNSIFRHYESAYPVKTPELTKKVGSATKIALIQEGPNSVEDRTSSSLINDCRDSAKLAMFLLEKIQVRSGRNMNKHVSLVLWDLMFRFSKYLDVPTFSKIWHGEAEYTYENSETNKRLVIKNYIKENDGNIAKELQDMIDNVFTKAYYVVKSKPSEENEETRTILNSIIEEWRKYIARPLYDKPYLGNLKERCGNLICGTNRDHNGKPIQMSTLILFRPERPDEDGFDWEKGLEYIDEVNYKLLESGQIPIWRPFRGERAGGKDIYGIVKSRI